MERENIRPQMESKRMNITCDTCHKTHSVRRTSEIPEHVISMGCNWCPECEDRAKEYYEEWYNESESGEQPEPVPDNQLVMPFIIEHIPVKIKQLT